VKAQKGVSHDNRTVWRFDPSHSTIEFSIRNLFFLTVNGRMKAVEGSIMLDDANLQRSTVVAIIDAAGIETGIKSRDAHLRSADFLNTKVYPLIEFRSSHVGPGTDRDMLKVRGLLTIAGKTREVELDVSEIDRSRSPRSEEVIYYLATTAINRSDFAITYWRGVIGDRLKVTINVQASRQLAGEVSGT